MLNVTAEFLDNSTICKCRLTDVSDDMSQEDERTFANSYVVPFQNEFNAKGLATQVQGDWAQCGNVIHPLLRFNSLKDYGSIGILFNKSIIIVLILEFGKTYQLAMRKEDLLSSSDALHERLSDWGNYSSGYGADNVFGLISQKNDMKRAKQLEEEAARIEYDPTEMEFEDEWMKEVSMVIKEMFGINND